MKRKLKGVLGVGLAFMLVASLMVVFAPVAAAADYEENDWGEWGLPSIDEGTDVGPMAVAPDGTIYAAVLDDGYWMVQKSEDGGFEWDDTDFEFNEDDPGGAIAQIVVSPNYDDDETIYVAVFNPATVYRLAEAGDANPIALRSISAGTRVLYSIDVWSDDDDNWIVAGTDDGVFEIKDAHGGNWIDYQLWDGLTPLPGYEVAFAPDFDEIEIIWALTDDGGEFMLTSTIAPGQWGQVIADAKIDGVGSTMWADIDFPDDYSSDVEDEVPLVFVALTDDTYDPEDGIGGVYMVEGVEAPGTSVATLLMDDEDMVSLAVSGDIILAGSLLSPEIYISDDLGASWDDVDKMPTGGDGDAWTHVVMAPGDFDPDDGVAYASTYGAESAFSRSEDGGEVWNQVGIIDTDIYEILDLAFHPDFPGTATFMMVTYSTNYSTYSLWLTDNGDEDEPYYYRVLCGFHERPSENPGPGNFDGRLYLVEYSQDAEAIYIWGDDTRPGDDETCTWKSTDDGQTFGKRRSVDTAINDWVITDSRTIYAATSGDGFYRSINSGLSWSTTNVGAAMNDIALSPDFDDGEGFIALGGSDGEVYLSDNEGDGFDETDAGLTNDVFVAFDADFADEDADGYMLIYAAGQGDAIQEGEISDTDDVDWDALEDDENDDTQAIEATGLQVAEDNALYAVGLAEAGAVTVYGTIEITGVADGDVGYVDIDGLSVTDINGEFEDGEEFTIDSYNLTVDVFGPDVTVSGDIDIIGVDSTAEGTFDLDEAEVDTTNTWVDDDAADVTDEEDLEVGIAEEAAGLVRLLLHESNSEWESASDSALTAPAGLWLSLGSNVLWTIDVDELWVLEDTLSGQVTLDSPPDGAKLDRLDTVRIAWDELRGADDDYEYRLDETSGLGTDIDGFTDDTDINVSVVGSSEYEWKVRVAPGEPWHSRWSDEWTFNTALGPAPWAPTLYTPGGVWQYSGLNVELMPAFSWESAKNADGYQFVLADNAEFTSPLVNEKTPESAYNLDFELEYNSNYFWRVMAYKGNDAISRWSDIGAFTTIEKAAPAPPAPAPPATVTQPAPAPIVLPTPIPPALLWTIIAIGALLIVAVIVLIVRTRRPV